MTGTEHYLVARYRRMLAERGMRLDPGKRILDFCCGSGDNVAILVNDGYDAYGFEPYAGVSPEGARFSTFGWQSPFGPPRPGREEQPEIRTEWRAARLPYSDCTFDFVFSNEVMEHISDHDAVTAEIARILKPGGIAIHSFPGRYQMIEPHCGIPLAGIIKERWWYQLWAWRAKRSVNYPNLRRRELADRWLWYARGSLNYLRPKQLIAIGRRYFDRCELDSALWNDSQLPNWLYLRTRQAVWILSGPHQPFLPRVQTKP